MSVTFDHKDKNPYVNYGQSYYRAGENVGYAQALDDVVKMMEE